jgi:hypothetical protein
VIPRHAYSRRLEQYMTQARLSPWPNCNVTLLMTRKLDYDREHARYASLSGLTVLVPVRGRSEGRQIKDHVIIV